MGKDDWLYTVLLFRFTSHAPMLSSLSIAFLSGERTRQQSFLAHANRIVSPFLSHWWWWNKNGSRTFPTHIPTSSHTIRKLSVRARVFARVIFAVQHRSVVRGPLLRPYPHSDGQRKEKKKNKKWSRKWGKCSISSFLLLFLSVHYRRYFCIFGRFHLHTVPSSFIPSSPFLTLIFFSSSFCATIPPCLAWNCFYDILFLIWGRCFFQPPLALFSPKRRRKKSSEMFPYSLWALTHARAVWGTFICYVGVSLFLCST